MAQHQTPCEICERLEIARTGRHPGFIAEMKSGVAVLGDSQQFRGYCLLLCKVPATELDELTPELRAQFLLDMATLAQAVRNVVHPHKLNYESLGNVVHHLHWHIFPRQLDESEPLKPVWLVMAQGDDAKRFAFDAERDAPLIEAIRAELKILQP